MVRVSESEFGHDVDRYQQAALDEPVIVTQDGRDRTVVISADEYRRLTRHDRRVYAAGEIPDRLIEAIRSSTMDPRHDHLDALLDDGTA